VALLIVIFY